MDLRKGGGTTVGGVKVLQKKPHHEYKLSVKKKEEFQDQGGGKKGEARNGKKRTFANTTYLLPVGMGKEEREESSPREEKEYASLTDEYKKKNRRRFLFEGRGDARKLGKKEGEILRRLPGERGLVGKKKVESCRMIRPRSLVKNRSLDPKKAGDLSGKGTGFLSTKRKLS